MDSTVPVNLQRINGSIKCTRAACKTTLFLPHMPGKGEMPPGTHLLLLQGSRSRRAPLPWTRLLWPSPFDTATTGSNAVAFTGFTDCHVMLWAAPRPQAPEEWMPNSTVGLKPPLSPLSSSCPQWESFTPPEVLTCLTCIIKHPP